MSPSLKSTILLLTFGILLSLTLVIACADEDESSTGSGDSDTTLCFNPSPAHWDTIYTDTFTLDWDCFVCGGGMAWDLYFGFESDPGLTKVADLSLSRHFVHGLEVDSTYAWQVVADVSVSRWCSTWVFVVKEPEVSVYGPTPAHLATGVPVDDNLVWRLRDPVLARPHTFDITLATADGTTWDTAETGLTDTTFDPGTLMVGQEYVWSVVAISNDDDTTVGPQWSFTADTVEVYGPTPDDLATGVLVDQNLLWQLDDPLGRPHTFDVTLATSDGTTWDTTETGLSTMWFEPGPLLPSQSYVWSVAAISDDNDTIVGPEWTFSTEGPGSIYAVLLVNSEPLDAMMAFDYYMARFDSTFAPSGPINPQEATSVTCNSALLWWQSFWSSYHYDQGSSPPLITQGETYDWHVMSSGAVPTLNTSITFPDCVPEITLPAPSDTVSLSGFTVTWNATCGSQVVLAILSGEDSTGVRVETPNDGSHTFTPAELAPLASTAGFYVVSVGVENVENIIATGYDPRSLLIARGYKRVFVRIE